MGVVTGIFISSAAGKPMQELVEARAVAGQGLEGDRYSVGAGHYSSRPQTDGGRELTLVECEVLDSLAAEHQIEFTPLEARRNIATRGVALQELIGQRFRVGEVLCEGVRICEPCVYIEGLTGKAVNAPLIHRGGLRARILRSGTIRKGDPVEALPAS